MTCLYLDDLRVPDNDKSWIIVRSFEEAVDWMGSNSCPDFISFDHDLGMIIKNGKILTGDYDAKSGHDLAKWIVEKDLDMDGAFIPSNFTYTIHSSNPTGSKNIDGVLSSYLREKNKSTLEERFEERRRNLV